MELLHQLRTALAETAEALTNARSERDRLDDTIATLELESRGLTLAIARRGGTETVQDDGGWQQLARTDAVVRVLEEADRSLGPAEVTEALQSRGRNDRRDPVAAALAYLKGTGRVVHEGTAAWTVPRAEPIPPPPPPTNELTVTKVTTGGAP